MAAFLPAASRPAGGRPFVVGLAGALALAVAMGIGRFAFTPLLPMMLGEQSIDLPQASWLATANYLGYLIGALLCMVLSNRWRLDAARLVRAGLVATTLLTLAMALPWVPAWGALRFLAGVASAVVFVFTSGWCLARLAALGTPALGGLIYVGPGAGIALSGLAVSAMVAWHWPSASGWLVFGVLAAGLTALVWPIFRPAHPAPAATAPAPVAPAAAGRSPDGPVATGLFVLAYGLAGFGYIITATFLPVIAREALPGSVWLDLFWPLLGLGVAIGALLATRIPLRHDGRHLLAGCYAVQALGVMASVWLPSLAGFALGSLLVGLPFTAITYFAMQEARRLRPGGAASFMGLLTAAYGLGQIAGPPLANALLHGGASRARGFTLSLGTASAALLLGALIFLWLGWAHPVRSSSSSGAAP
ncbi:YbfB/YjiJ family MFS transporter [Variovorax terrae]|uniref:YbfB/YjiJ family MFS transporter n=1 Tax=Variovorax terrae TaxID=2923278 RepID=A0A9X2AP39_9BURK|nr:YbfB/YjiJ family MFS transporter [Variovorax terrae]MCJ0765438.1 YbfB/YjiJ family MFS transporter [Variovorax terrae]